MASTDAKPVPVKNAAFRVTFPILDADGDLVTGAASLDSEVSKDGGTFADCTNEATEIATSSGVYYLDLTSTEMNADTVSIIVKTSTSGAKTTTIVLYPQESGDINVNIQSITAGAIGAAGFDSDFYQEIGRTSANGLFNTLYYVSPDGSDSNDGLSPTTAFLTLSHAVGVAAAYDAIFLGAGTYTENSGVTLPDNVSLFGSGRRSTIIQSSLNLNSGGGCILVPGDNSIVANLQIYGTAASTVYQAAIGSNGNGGGDQAFVGAFILNVDTYATTDGIFLDSSSECNLVAENCRFTSDFDCCAVFTGTCRATLRRCELRAQGPSGVTGGDRASAISCASGRVEAYQCDLAAYDGISETYTVFSEDNAGESSVVLLKDCALHSEATSGALDIRMTGGGDVHTCIVEGGSYVPSKCTSTGSGSITFRPAPDNIQQIDGSATTSMAELSAAPGSSPSLVTMLKWIYQMLNHKVESTSSVMTMRKKDGTTSLSTSSISDNGTTFTRGGFA